MSRILMGWEFGGGLGHVASLVKLATRIRDDGHNPVFVIAAQPAAIRFLKSHSFEFCIAPSVPRIPTPMGFQADSFADILWQRGFADPPRLRQLVRQWIRVLQDNQPDAIIADFAPGLVLAACDQMPIAVTGSGFLMAPVDQPQYPTLGLGSKPSVDQQLLLDVINRIQKSLGHRQFDYVTELMRGTKRCVMTIKEFDPYRSVRNEPYAGPLDGFVKNTPHPETPKAFAYLSAEYRHAFDVLRSLSLAKVPLRVLLRDATAEFEQQIESLSLDVVYDAEQIDQVMNASSVIIHHGGLGMSINSLTSGRPQIVLPRYLEQGFNGREIQAMSLGHCFAGEFDPGVVGRCVAHVMEDSEYGQRAMMVANRLWREGPQSSMEEMRRFCRG